MVRCMGLVEPTDFAEPCALHTGDIASDQHAGFIKGHPGKVTNRLDAAARMGRLDRGNEFVDISRPHDATGHGDKFHAPPLSRVSENAHDTGSNGILEAIEFP